VVENLPHDPKIVRSNLTIDWKKNLWLYVFWSKTNWPTDILLPHLKVKKNKVGQMSFGQMTSGTGHEKMVKSVPFSIF
jgi:hypothetical protein